jgi:hypothetical protein
MNSNKLAYLIILAAALGFAACGGAAENSRGDGKAAGTSPTVNAASPAPTTGGGANTVPVSDNAAHAPAASSSGAAAQTGASPAPAARGAGSAPQAKAPTPQIGSGGNDLFLFTQARAAINDDADLKAANVVIEVKEGVVTLSGNVASATLKSKAEQLARGAGAKDLKNQLRVSAGR